MGENIALGVLLAFALVVAALSYKPPAPTAVHVDAPIVVTSGE